MRKVLTVLLMCVLSLGQTTVLPKTTTLPKTTLLGKGSSGGAPVNCGNTAAFAATDANAQTPQATPCTTGANAAGYAVSSITFDQRAIVTDTFDLAVYSDSSGSASSLVCHLTSTSITTVVGLNTKTISGCGTLSANTAYWIAFISNGADTYGYTTTCSGAINHSVFGANTGNSTLPSSFGTNSNLGECQVIYMTLNPN